MFSKLRAEIDRLEAEIEELFERKKAPEPSVVGTSVAMPLTFSWTAAEVATVQAVPAEPAAAPLAAPNNIA